MICENHNSCEHEEKCYHAKPHPENTTCRTECASYCGICREGMKDKMDLIWGIEQMERELSKNHSPASNIMSICTEVRKQVNELLKGK